MASGTVYQKANSIEEAQDLYGRAMAAGDTELAQQYHKDAEAMRAKEGYSGGVDGSQHIPLAPGTKVDSGSIDLGNASYVPGGIGGAGKPGGTGGSGGASSGKPGGTGGTGYSRSPEIDALVNAQKQAALAQLKAAVQKQVSGYNEQIAGLEPQYQGLRSQSEVERYKSQKALRESLANSGELSGGQGRQDLLNLQNAYSSRLNDLNAQQQAQVDSLSRAIAEAKSQGDLQAAMLEAQYDAQAAELGLSDRYRYEDNLYRDRQAAFQNALAEAGLTGVYNGQNTLAMQQYLTDKALAEGQLMGVYGGQQTMAAKNADRQYGLDYANTYGYGPDGQQTLAGKQWDQQVAWGNADRTGYLDGERTLAGQQLDMDWANMQHNWTNDEKALALQMVQNGFSSEQIAAALGVPLADAQRISGDNAKVLHNQAYPQNFNTGGGRGGSTSSRKSSSGGKSGGEDDDNPHKKKEKDTPQFSSNKVKRYYETYSGTTHNNLASPGQTVDAIEYLVSKGELTNAEGVELLNALGLAGMLEVREKQNR